MTRSSSMDPASRSDADGEVIAQAKSFEEDLIFVDTEALTGDIRPEPDDESEATFRALVLGTRDYVQKCGFSKTIIALSGGIDSPWSPRLALKPSAKTMCSLSACPALIPRRALSTTAAISPKISASALKFYLSARSLNNTTRRSRRFSQDSSPTSPKKTFSRAFAPVWSWPRPTNSTLSCSPPATKVKCPPATARSTETWPEP